MKKDLEAARVRELLDYDPQSGKLTWRVCRGLVRAGQTASGALNDGYQRIKVDGRVYRVHRVIWLHVYGAWPHGPIDHRDGDRSNNSLANLRLCSVAQNNQNVNAARGQSGLLGASFHKASGRWYSRICVDGKERSLGLFDTAREAHAAYVAAKTELHPFWAGAEQNYRNHSGGALPAA